jgi:hypothetical protein
VEGRKNLAGEVMLSRYFPLMPPLIMQENVPQPRFWIWVSLTFLIGILITILRDKKGVNQKKNKIDITA